MGFRHQDHSGEDVDAIKRVFSPEFRNRLDAVIPFRALDRTTIVHVVDKFILELEGQLEERNVTIDFDPDARVWLAEHGFDAAMGARPMARLLREKVKKPLADELLFGRLAGGGNVRVSVQNDELVFVF